MMLDLRGSRVLVTGGAGFIGSHLTEALLDHDCRVTVLDDFSSGDSGNLIAALKTGRVSVVEGSVLDSAALAKAMKGADYVFHLAVQCVRRSLGKPLENHDVNATGTLLTLETARRLKVRRFIYCFSSAVNYLKAAQGRGDLGEILYIDAVRVNLGLFQQHGNVIVDLAPHDVSIINDLLSETPTHVSTVVSSCVNDGLADVAYVTLYYPQNILAHAHLSWLSPVKLRRMTIAGSNKMAVWDDLETDRVKIYDKGVLLPLDRDSARVHQLVDYRLGDMFAPNLRQHEPLEAAIEEFYNAVVGRHEPRSGGRFGLDVVRVLDAIETSVAHYGQRVAIRDAEAIPA